MKEVGRKSRWASTIAMEFELDTSGGVPDLDELRGKWHDLREEKNTEVYIGALLHHRYRLHATGVQLICLFV